MVQATVIVPFGPFRAQDKSWDLGNFAVLTGANGSGKSHLLRRMLDAIPSPNSPNLPPLSLYVDTQTLHQLLREETVGADRSKRIQDALGIAAGWDEYLDKWPEVQIEAVASALAIHVDTVAAWVARVGRPLRTFSGDDYDELVPIGPVVSSIFTGAWETRFTAYMDLMVDNEIRGMIAERFSVDDVYLPPDEFRARFGEPPWDTLNRALDIMRLPYRLDVPGLHTYVAQRMQPFSEDVLPATRGRVRPLLRSRDGAALLSLDQLSTGEQTILALTTSLYATTLGSDSPSLPRLIALDEIDATLHPSMVRALMAYVTDELVERLGIDVVMTTHSPTTVALAPPDSIWVVDAFSEDPLRKTTADEALSQLLVGVPSLSVKSENRRIVMVESRNDSRWYQQIFLATESLLASERSLVFMPVGGDQAEGPEGCERVIQLVTDLRRHGNGDVWGLIDKDTRQTSPPGVHFPPERYSIENYVLDPLSLGLHMLRAHAGQDHGLEDFSESEIFSGSRAQELVHTLTQKLFPSDEGPARTTQYFHGLELDIPEVWLTLQGHDLFKKIRECWPVLKTHNQQLLDRIISGVWANHPAVIPQDITRVMHTLLTA